MRRAAVLILLLALLGVSTSLGVAWFIGGVQPERFTAAERQWGRVGGWTVATRTVRGLRVSEAFGFPVASGLPDRPPSGGSVYAQAPRPTDERTTEWDIGWPFFSWRTVWREHPSGYGLITSGDLEGGLLIEATATQVSSTSILTPASSMESITRLLPLRPIWPGVVYDSAAWSAAWLVITVILLVPGVQRRRLRLRRNRCTMCGYDLRGREAAICSECGAARGARGPLLGNRILGALGAVLLLLIIAQITIGAKVAGLRHGPHPLHFAARDGDVRGIERRLRSGVPVDLPVKVGHDAAGTTPLIWAIAGDQPDAVRRLLDRGANANAKDKRGEPAIALALRRGSEPILAALLEAGAEADASDWEGQPALRLVIGAPEGEACARLLIRAGADVNRKWRDFTPLALAAARNDLAVARVLIDAGATVNAPVENLPIIAAVELGHVEMVDLLIRSRAEVARAELDLLRIAVETGRTEVVAMLLAHGAPRPAPAGGSTLLHLAVRGGNTPMVRLLTQSGFDPTIRDESGRTPFEQALEAAGRTDGFDEIVEILDGAVRAWYLTREENGASHGSPRRDGPG